MWDAAQPIIRVLLVEDTPLLRQALSRLLRMNGYEVVEAANGQAALDMLERYQPDLIVTDLSMPVMDGLELIRRLRDDARTAALPIVVVTAEPSAQAEIRARQAGAAAFLSKPLDVPVLLTHLQSYHAN